MKYLSIFDYKKRLMRSIIYCILSMLIATTVLGQTLRPPTPLPIPVPTVVHLKRSFTPVLPVQDSQKLTILTSADSVVTVTEYFDEFGRPLQSVLKQYSPKGKDLVNAVFYDDFGNTSRGYLPYVSTSNNGYYKEEPFKEDSTFYKSLFPNDPYNYTQQFYDASPLNRIIKQTAAGSSWTGANRGVSNNLRANNPGDSVRLWTLDANDQPVTTVRYLPGTLSVSETTNENGQVTVTYTNSLGQTVLVKQKLDSATTNAYSGWLCTYYLYDELGHLMYVLPPKAVAYLALSVNAFQTSASLLFDLCYQYRYDDLARPIAKKVPGAGWSYIVYDKRSRPVFVQDAALRQSPSGTGAWAYTLYDITDRPLQTGIMRYNVSRDSLQHYVDAHTGNAIAGTVTVTDSLVRSIPGSISLNLRVAGINKYEATKNIDFDAGFTTEDNAAFTAEIVQPNAGNTFTASVTVTDNPIPPSAVTVPLNIIFYDEYVNASKTYDNSNNNKLTAGSSTNADTLPSTRSLLTKGMATSSRTRVIEDPTNLTKGRWMETVSFYDEYGRVVQSKGDNYKGGEDITTIRYDYTGKALCRYSVHSNPAASVANLRVKTNMDYDRTGRLLQITKQLNDDPATQRIIQRNEYNELGQLITKRVGQKNAADTAAMEVQNYTYTIRGWLKSMNAPENTSSGVAGSSPWFGYALAYDSGTTAQYAGNIASIRWQSGGDRAVRSYVYTYDAVNRLMSADFNQKFGSTWAKTDPANTNFSIDYSVKMGNGVNPYTAYDENGNIKSMTQRGLLLNSSKTIDSLVYSYAANSNKLLSVGDAVSSPNEGLGDYKDGNTLGDDYAYDSSGSVIQDKNKGHTLTYNQFNLPSKITIPGRGDITYIYAANGQKLEKRTHILKDSTRNNIEYTSSTSYVAGVIYQDNKFSFFAHEEGRIRKKITDSSFVYDYFLKDHLSNIRTVLTDEQKVDAYRAATMELANQATDTALYSNIVNTRSDKPPGYPVDNYTNPNDKVAKLDGVDKKIGPGIALKVMAGDTFNIRVSSWYRQGTVTPDQPADPLTDLLTALVNGVSGAAATAHGAINIANLQNNGMLSPNATKFLKSQGGSTSNPKAYVNWILFDEHFNYDSISSGFEQVGNDTILTIHTKANLTVNKSGYLYVYVSNVTGNIPVYFDNLQVTHKRGPLVEEDHYYPFGLQMKAICSKAAGSIENKYKFNGGVELNEDFDISIYETSFRGYDAQIGRFGAIDIKAETQYSLSAYHFSNNNPVRYNDPSGDDYSSPIYGRRIDPFAGTALGWDGEASIGGGSGNGPFHGWSNSEFTAYAQGLLNNAPNTSVVYSDQVKETTLYYSYENNDKQSAFYTPHNHGVTFQDENGWENYTGSFVISPLSNASNNEHQVFEETTRASLIDGNFSNQDLINIGISFTGAALGTMEGILRNERTEQYAANIARGMSRPLTSKIANLDGAIGRFSKYGRKLGVAGAVLTAANLTYKYFNDGITRKDIFDGVVSAALLAVTVTNPIGLVGLAAYGFADSVGLLDGIKDFFGADDTVVRKYEP